MPPAGDPDRMDSVQPVICADRIDDVVASRRPASRTAVRNVTNTPDGRRAMSGRHRWPPAVLLLLALFPAPRVAAQPVDHRVVIVAYDTNDVRLPMAFDAVKFWNEVLVDLGLNMRLVEELHVAPPITRALENYARSISQRAGRLRGGPGEPDAPTEITDFGAEAVLLLSRQDLMSFAWPLPRRPGHFVAIEEDRTAMAVNPNIARNIIAHEIGHTLGLRHNRDPTTLMCGPCRTNELAVDRPEYMGLTERDRRRLIERYASR